MTKIFGSSSDDHIGIGSIVWFDEADVKEVRNVENGYVVELNSGEVYNLDDMVTVSAPMFDEIIGGR